ncbi:ExeM/NucH family extracellular endonuclease [Wenzhouxiangella sp. XN79A]|uniref:ExeM/NucH family extracellular endonuclease n=1 Tax=Wenzhouxiangella sp. XN79A TaxID=2724193 RepID=UPI00144AE4F3|nr:ExeM/NucH family extracellular endonuclease [Wenzhouxiangella sp. XN79A]NKI34007.1 ExeM/NucH family extracellular endonuclease [Wenzhouxiangella sp. XN79A]
MNALRLCLPLVLLALAGCAAHPPTVSDRCDADRPITPIHQVQGSGTVSPLLRATVQVEGIVVGDFQHRSGEVAGAHGDLHGFAVQEQANDTDADPATSEGIFVMDGTASPIDLAPGDRVCVTGRVAEVDGETRIDATANGGRIAVLERGLPLPTARTVALPASGVIVNEDGFPIGDLERFEGERVRIDGPLTVTDLFDLDRYGQFTVSSGGRLVSFTQTNAPDPAGFAAARDSDARRSLIVDDGSDGAWPDPVPYPPPRLALDNLVRAGDTVDNLEGVLSYRRAEAGSGALDYRLMPTAEPRFRADNPRPVPPEVDGEVTVAAFNVEFFYNGDGGDPASFPIRDGRVTHSEYLRQRAKLVTALAELDADIVGLNELENDYPDGARSAVADLVDGLNDALGEGTYAWLDPGIAFGTSPLVNGLIYKPAAVTPVGPLVWLQSDAFANPGGAYPYPLHRAALTQTFDTAAGAFTVSVNHLKSKGCRPDPIGLDNDPRDGASCFNHARTVGALALLEWFATDPTDTAEHLGAFDPDFLIIGDLNAHPAEDPLAALKAGPDAVPGNADDWVDLLAPDDYSYVFRGRAGRLDHAVASPTLAAQVSGAGVWHINADESDAFEFTEDHPAPAALYDVDPYRSSDHDAVVVGLE